MRQQKSPRVGLRAHPAENNSLCRALLKEATLSYSQGQRTVWTHILQCLIRQCWLHLEHSSCGYEERITRLLLVPSMFLSLQSLQDMQSSLQTEDSSEVRFCPALRRLDFCHRPLHLLFKQIANPQQLSENECGHGLCSEYKGTRPGLTRRGIDPCSHPPACLLLVAACWCRTRSLGWRRNSARPRRGCAASRYNDTRRSASSALSTVGCTEKCIPSIC